MLERVHKEVLAVLGPVVGARTILNPSPRDHGKKEEPKPRDPLADFDL